MNWSYAISGVVMEQQQCQVVLGGGGMAVVVFVCKLFSDLVVVKRSYVTWVPIIHLKLRSKSALPGPEIWPNMHRAGFQEAWEGGDGNEQPLSNVTFVVEPKEPMTSVAPGNEENADYYPRSIAKLFLAQVNSPKSNGGTNRSNPDKTKLSPDYNKSSASETRERMYLPSIICTCITVLAFVCLLFPSQQRSFALAYEETTSSAPSLEW